MLTLFAVSLACSGDLLHRDWGSYGKYPPPVAPYTLSSLPAETIYIPMIHPILGYRALRNNYNHHRGSHRHTGIDMPARKMTPIVAPFTGVFGNKLHSFWIYGDNGYRCLATHLNDDTPGTNDGKNNPDFMFAPNLRFGDRVVQGQLIGYVGNSGQATGPHLHFEIHTDRGIRNPFQSLQYAQVIREPRLELRAKEDKPAQGQERYEVCKRHFNREKNAFYGILVAKQYDNGRVVVSSKPSFVTMPVPEEIANDLAFENWAEDRPASIYFERKGDQILVNRIIPPTE